MQNRRGFIKSSSIASLGLISLSQNLYSINRFSSRKMKISLMPGTIGVNVNANELLDLAIKNNFESIYPLINDIKQIYKKYYSIRYNVDNTKEIHNPDT